MQITQTIQIVEKMNIINIIKKQKIQRIIVISLVLIVAALFTWVAPIKSAEYLFSDMFLIKAHNIENKIKIIGIDEKSLQELGPFQDWTRQKAADLLNSFDENNKPTLVAFDINYFGERDKDGDFALVESVSKFSNVVMASYIDFSTKMQVDDLGEKRINQGYIKAIEKPYGELAYLTNQGFTNVIQDTDNYVRRAVYKVEYGDEKYYNFAYSVYKTYMESLGKNPIEPNVDSLGIYGFDYTAPQGGYELYSFSDIINKRCDLKVFKDSIVFVGAYSSGMMDQYFAPISRGSVMNGVEIQANHFNALLDGRTYSDVPTYLTILINSVVLLIFMLLMYKLRIRYSILLGFLIIGLSIFSSVILYENGLCFKCFNLILFIVLIMISRIIFGYLQAKIKQAKILDMFRKYIAPQVVDELAKNKDFYVDLGGVTKDVAVLFIDIRGFSSMTEVMPAEQVVEILNKYFELVTTEVFKNDGMLDKFIGDAVMAVYNAPLDIENYEKKAIMTGLNILKELENLNKELKEKNGTEIACGIGIHCGKAVVGNIGCSYRMDYTVIGDTVNIAERLESIAKGGKINISKEVYDRVKDEFDAIPKGSYMLKGKNKEVFVYEMGVVYESENV